jgi:hypothetical protein
MIPGERRDLERISEELELDSEIMGFLDDSGMRPGARLEFVTETPQGAVTVRVGDRDQVGIDEFMANRLFVAV